MFETGIVSAPIQILETPTTLFLLSPRHLQFFNNKKSSLLSFEFPVFKALICSQYIFAASRSHVVKVDMTDVSCTETYAYDIDITNISLFKSRLVVVQDMFVNIQGMQEECFDHSVVAVNATDNYLFVILSDGSLYRYSSRFEYLRKVKNAFDIKVGDMLFVANDKTRIDILDFDGKQIKRVKVPGVVLKLVVGDSPGQDATSSGCETTSIHGSSLSVLVGVNGVREVVFYNSKYSVISRLGCLDCFSSGYNMYVRMSHSEYDVVYHNKLKPFIRNIERIYKYEYYTIGVSGRNMYLLRNEAILNSMKLDEEIVDIVFVKNGSRENTDDCKADDVQELIFVVFPKSIAKIADIPSFGLVHVMDFEFMYGICGIFMVVLANRQVLLFDLSIEEVIEKMDEELQYKTGDTGECLRLEGMADIENRHGTKTQYAVNGRHMDMERERMYRKIIFREEFYKLRNDDVLLVGDESFAEVCDFMVSDERLVLLSRDDVRMYRIESSNDEHARSIRKVPSGEGHSAREADRQASSKESSTTPSTERTAAEYSNACNGKDEIPESPSARYRKERCENSSLQQMSRFTLIASMPVQYERYAFGTSTLFLCSKTSVIAVGDKVVHKQENVDGIYTYRYEEGFVVLKKGGRFAIYDEYEFAKSKVSRMRAVNLSHDDFNFKAFVERENMLETLEKGAERLSVRAEEYASVARRTKDKIRKKKYWFF